MQKLIDIGKQVLDSVDKTNTSVEIFVTQGEEFQIYWSDGKLEEIKQGNDQGIGMRVIDDGKLGFAASNDFSEQSLKDIVKESLDSMNFTTEDENYVLPEQFDSELYPAADKLQIYDHSIEKFDIQQKIQLLQEKEQFVLKQDSRVKKVLAIVYDESIGHSAILNSNGLCQMTSGTYSSFSVACLVGQNGDIQIGSDFAQTHFYADLDLDTIILKAITRGISLLGSKRIASGKMVALFEPMVACEFLGLISDSFCADSVQKKSSYLINKIGEIIASPLVNLVDDGILVRGNATNSFDAEGVPTQRKILIENGILKQYLYDTYTARKDGVKSTGNAGRGSYYDIPEPAPTNFYLLPGTKSSQELIKETKSGVYVTEIMGMHTADTISGEFSVGFAGIRIENGEFTHSVRGVTIAGNIWELLNCLDGVGNDLTFYGSVGSPTIRFPEVMVGGE